MKAILKQVVALSSLIYLSSCGVEDPNEVSDSNDVKINDIEVIEGEDFGKFPMDKLVWLIGLWQDSANVNQWEEWELTETGLKSQGMFIKGNDTTLFESLKIEQRGENIFMVADVKENAAPVEFKVTKLRSDLVLFENPRHDFPKQILYQLVNVKTEKGYQQKIRGEVRSGDRGFSYAMIRR